MEKNLWIWNWKSGGYNYAEATTSDEALEKAKHLARYTNLQVDESTLHKGNYKEISRLQALFAD